jgi:hypothetical protein
MNTESSAQPVQQDSRQSADTLHRTGMGNWDACFIPQQRLLDLAASWRRHLEGIEYPWLCWNVDSDWCVLQQRLVKAVGWTPLVGYDPRVGAPPLVPGAVAIDFNSELGLPTMYPHFVVEFAFQFCDRLAFWHSDLLVRLPVLQRLAATFRELSDGEIAAVPSRGHWRGLLRPWSHRYWELIACTTRGASRSQYELGAGWWYNFPRHPNFRGKATLFGRPYYWDHGTGVMYWARATRAHIHEIPEALVREGHFSSIGANNYRRRTPNNHFRNLNIDLRDNFDLAACAKRMELDSLLTDVR